jgi:hypothetical protein
VKYSIEEVIIARNFYLEKDDFNRSENIKESGLKSIRQKLMDKKPILKFIDINKPSTHQRAKLTMKSFCFNVTCCRYFLCRRRNKILLVYKEVKKVICKYLSAEYLLYYLMKLKKLESIRRTEWGNSEGVIDLISSNEDNI